MLSKEDIEEFKKIYREEFDEELSDEKALKLAISVSNLMKAFYQPLPSEVQKECLIQDPTAILLVRALSLSAHPV